MIAISFTFPAGRYHATPWGRHVNEGAVEWPPSPWRLLRSLVAVWKRTMPEAPQESVEPILRVLAAPPRFALPSATTGHTRHYMPWEKNWKADQPAKAKTKVFDAFVALAPDAPIVACWPGVDLEPKQRELLSLILANLNFLGRAESWCEARLLDREEAETWCDSTNCRLVDELSVSPANDELVRTLCLDPDSAFLDTHVVDEEESTSGKGKSKVTTKVRRAVCDPNWHLCMETLRLHEQKWSDPPGSCWVSYSRRRDCFEIQSNRARTRVTQRPAPQVVRFALDSAVLPRATDTLPVAEAARRALMSLQGQIAAQDGVRGRSDMLSGKNADGTPLTGHSHAYFLPTDEDGDGRLDHLTIFARGGFGRDEMRAINCFRQFKPIGRDNASHPLRVLLLGHGELDDFRPLPVKPSTVWQSVTPYIATRHAKTRGSSRVDLADWNSRVAFLVADLRAQLLAVRPDIPEADIANTKVTAIPVTGPFQVASRWRPLEFVRARSKSEEGGRSRPAGAFQIEFPHAVNGPIALGTNSHFGMGLFLPLTP